MLEMNLSLCIYMKLFRIEHGNKVRLNNIKRYPEKIFKKNIENTINNIILKAKVMVLNSQYSRKLIESIEEDTACVLDYGRRAAKGLKRRLNCVLKT